MAWIESHQGLAHHPKTKRLARELDETIPSAIGRLHLLWWWALEYAQDGSLEKFDGYDIADALMWKGQPDELLAALKVAGWIDDDLYIHDWHDYAGRLIAQREKNAERMKETRAKRKAKKEKNVQDTFIERASHVQGYQHNQQYQHNSTNTTTHNSGDVVAKEIVSFYEHTFSKLPNPTQVDELVQYTQLGMEVDLVKQALHKSRLKGKDISYAIGILDKQHTRGILTVAQAEEEEAQRETVATGGETSAKSRVDSRQVQGLSRTKDGGRFGVVK